MKTPPEMREGDVMSAIEPGQCFKVETSYGDDRPSWTVYRRVRATIVGYAECHRFETRSDGMHAMYPADPIRLRVLGAQTPIEAAEWLDAWDAWQRAVTEPWNVE